MSCCTDWPSEQDSALHDLYARKLLEPSWAGEINDVEAAYIASHLSESASLRHAWRIQKVFGKRWRRISPAMVKTLAAWWLRNAPSETKTLSSISGQKSHSR